jgi:hypothetical protein
VSWLGTCRATLPGVWPGTRIPFRRLTWESPPAGCNEAEPPAVHGP